MQNMSSMRAAKKLKALQKPPVPRTSYPNKVSKKKFIKALEGTGGIKTVICERLGCCQATLWKLINREDWADMRQAYVNEVERVGDLAEETIIKAIQDTTDMTLATTNARWYLSRKCKDRGYGEQSEVNVQGTVNTVNTTVDVRVLALPLEIRRQILLAIEKEQKELPGPK